MELLSEWGEKLNRIEPLPDYPRMQLQRDSFVNLNGIWQYQITERKEDPNPNAWQEIVVPFALGSKLCGVKGNLPKGKALWYRKQFAYKPTPSEHQTRLNFEAVDMECMVFMNGIEVCSHQGGYTPFSMDITQYIKYQNALMVRCIDDTEDGMFAFGKQRTEHGGMWYTPTAGIWGTVWLEDLPEHAVEDIKLTPDLEKKCVHVSLTGNFSQALITIAVDGHVIHSGLTDDKTYTAPIPNVHSWTPEDPFLYDVYVQTEDDFVRSYFGMRSFTKGFDSHGIPRFFLNQKPLFLTGLLDQGMSVDGSYTYPADDAMIYEIKKIKDLGYNMVRKHMKVESRRWYYHADRLGLLVMQDIPCGGFAQYDVWTMGILPNLGFCHMDDTKDSSFTRKEKQLQDNYYQELLDILEAYYNTVSIFAWVPFNEGWGQFNASAVTNRIRSFDRTRLVDSASGWHDQRCGDFASIHNYFLPFHAKKDKQDRILILSEFGGYSLVDYLHSEPKKEYGYKKFKDIKVMNEAIQNLYQTKVLNNIEKGLSGCIYTQVSDIEDECNGIFTADRKLIKIDERRMRRLNERLIRRLEK